MATRKRRKKRGRKRRRKKRRRDEPEQEPVQIGGLWVNGDSELAEELELLLEEAIDEEADIRLYFKISDGGDDLTLKEGDAINFFTNGYYEGKQPLMNGVMYMEADD